MAGPLDTFSKLPEYSYVCLHHLSLDQEQAPYCTSIANGMFARVRFAF